MTAQPLPARSIEREGVEQVMPGLEAFVDGVVASHMAEHVAGTQVAVVKDGRVLLVKGYGIARTKPERPVDAERSLFRIASISKTFTWLALMQLVDAGKLRLDDDVNKHLPRDLQLPKGDWDKPVRVMDLMNHTAGFEEPVWLADPTDETLLRSLRETLSKQRPARVRAAGTLFSYSNYGAALAGGIIAHVSGMEFESYVEQHIFTPLGMKRTTFRDRYGPGALRGLPAAMPAELAADMAVALEWRDGKWHAQPYHHMLSDAPAGAAVSTASDMARYMLALLDPVLLEAVGVLSARSHALFRQESFVPAPGVQGMHHGFFNVGLGTHCKLGYANLSHGGNAAHFESFLTLLPEQSLGIFVSTNSASGVPLSRDVPEQVVRHYFPLKPVSDAAPISHAALAQYAGDYRALRRVHTKLPALFGIDDLKTLTVGPNDCLLVPMPRAEPTACFLRVQGDLFEKADGDARLSFLRDARGQITHVVGALSAERVRLLDTGLWLRSWLAAGLVMVLAVLVVALRRLGANTPTLWQRVAAGELILTAAAWLGFYLVAGVWYLWHGTDALRDYPQPILVLGLRLLVAAVTLSSLGVLMLPLIWRGPGFSLWRRIGHTCVLLGLLGLCLALQRWNVIGFHYF